MAPRPGKWLIAAAMLALLSVCASALPGQTTRQVEYEMRGVDVVEKIGEPIPLDLEFTDDDGRSVTLAQYFTPGKPVLITLNYAMCPMLCSLQLTELARALKPMEWTPGQEFLMLTVSIDPSETFRDAKRSKVRYLGALDRSVAAEGWHFLVSEDESRVKALADALGFTYRFDGEKGEFVHKAAAFVVNGDGVISHYLRNLNYDTRDIHARLQQSAQGIMGEVSEDDTGFGMNCFTMEWTDNMGRAFMMMRIGGGGILLFIVCFLAYWWIYELKKSRRIKAEAT